MPFQIHALPKEPFQPLFKMSEPELTAVHACRMEVEAKPGYPCRVSLADAEIGEAIILVHFTHQPASSPYRASHAIFVREHAEQAFPKRGEIPDVLTTRLMSVRCFDSRHFMVNANVVDGTDLGKVIPAMLQDPAVEYLHLHNAKPGCYAARVTRS